MFEKLKRQFVETIIRNMNILDQYYLTKEYCTNMQYWDGEPICFDELNNICSNMSPIDIINEYSECINMEYFYLNKYGHAEEWTGIENNLSVNEIIDCIIENDDALGNDDIQEALDIDAESIVDEVCGSISELISIEEAEESGIDRIVEKFKDEIVIGVAGKLECDVNFIYNDDELEEIIREWISFNINII